MIGPRFHTLGDDGRLVELRNVTGPTSVTLSMPSCNDQTAVRWIDVAVSHTFMDIPFVAQRVRCLPRFAFTDPATQLPPNRSFLVHVLDDKLSSRAAVLGLIGGVFLQSTLAHLRIVVTFRGSDAVLAMNASRGEAGLEELQRALLGAAPFGSVSGCTIGLNPLHMPAANDLLVLTGDTDTRCSVDNSWSELGSLLTGSGVRAFWVGEAPRAPPFATGVAFAVSVDPVYEFYSAFQRHLSVIAALRCTGAVRFSPSTVPLAQRTLVVFEGVCDIARCCIGDTCSSLVVTTGQRVSCYTPLLVRAGQFVVTLVARDGRTRLTASDYMTVVPPTAGDVGAARDVRFVQSGGSWNATPLASVKVVRNSNVAAVSMNTTTGVVRCCRVVGLSGPSLDVVGGVDEVGSACLNATDKALTFPLELPYKPLLPVELSALAVQCVTPRAVSTIASVRPPGTGDVVRSIPPQTAPPGTAIANAAGDLPENWGRLKRRRIDAMLRSLMSSVSVQSGGYSLERVVDAIEAAGLRSSYPSEPRPCETGEVPQVDRLCFFKWSRHAANAGPYLVGAGFSRLATDWYLSNAVVGDVVVFPSLTVFNPDTRQLEFHPHGHIAVKWESSSTLQGYEWVSDFVHTSMVYDHIYSAVDAYVAPTLYRLADDAVEWPGDGELLVALWGVDSYVQSPTQWAELWASLDARVTPLDFAVATVAAAYSCPSTDVDESRFPQQLWRIPLVAAMSAHASRCYRLVATGSRAAGVRCCYDGSGAFVPQWPSQVEYTPVGLVHWASAIDAERTCCLGPGKDSDSCRLYRQRRPSPSSTTRPFGGTQQWTPNAQWSGAFGDPHCVTYDGTPFECNFDGEVRYSSCEQWSVHVVARPVPGSLATVIVRVAVRYASDTVLVVRSSDIGAESLGVPFVIFVNGERISPLGGSSTFVAVLVENRTVTISDAASNFVRVTVFDSWMAVVTVPGTPCRNQTSGLTGNNNGDPSDDFLPRGAADVIPMNSTNETIYTWFVLSQLVLDLSDSLFPSNLFVPGNLSYVPLFGNETELAASCPAACNGDTSCCFDVAAGGLDMIAPYLAIMGELRAARDVVVVVGAPEPPVFLSAPATFVITLESLLRGTTFLYVAEDSTVAPAIECDACLNRTVAGCAQRSIGPNRTELTMRVVFVQAMTIVCTARSRSTNLTTVATTVVYRTDALYETYAPTQAPEGDLPIGVPERFTNAPSGRSVSTTVRPTASVLVLFLLLVFSASKGLL